MEHGSHFMNGTADYTPSAQFDNNEEAHTIAAENNLAETAFFDSVAHLHPATFFAVLSGIIEFFGGIGVGVGLLGRLAALGLFGDMVIAMVTVTWRNGIVSSAVGGGYELNVALGALALGVAILGTGDISLDAALGSLAKRWRRWR